MRAVFKYTLPISDEFELLLPRGAELLSVQGQHDAAQLWALVNQDALLVPFRFRLLTTGEPVDPRGLEGLTYLGTFQVLKGTFVGHVWGAQIEEQRG